MDFFGDGGGHASGGFASGRGEGDAQVRLAFKLQGQDSGQHRGLAGAGAASDDGKVTFQGQGGGKLLVVFRKWLG